MRKKIIYIVVSLQILLISGLFLSWLLRELDKIIPSIIIILPLPLVYFLLLFIFTKKNKGMNYLSTMIFLLTLTILITNIVLGISTIKESSVGLYFIPWIVFLIVGIFNTIVSIVLTKNNRTIIKNIYAIFICNLSPLLLLIIWIILAVSGKIQLGE